MSSDQRPQPLSQLLLHQRPGPGVAAKAVVAVHHGNRALQARCCCWGRCQACCPCCGCCWWQRTRCFDLHTEADSSSIDTSAKNSTCNSALLLGEVPGVQLLLWGLLAAANALL
jgi:hypothetical protein